MKYFNQIKKIELKTEEDYIYLFINIFSFFSILLYADLLFVSFSVFSIM